MNTLGKLTKFQLDYYLRPRFESKKDRNKFIGICVFMAVCFIFPIVAMIGSVYMGTSMAIAQGVLPEVLSSLFLSTQLATIVLGAITYINIMYFSKDNRILLTLPIKSTTIYISKTIVSFVSMLMVSTLMSVPSLISSAVAIGNAGVSVGWSYYLFGILSLIALPLITLMVMSIVVFPIMKIVSYLKKRPVIFSIVSVAFSLGIMAVFYSFGFMMGGEDEGMANIVANISNMGRYSYATLVLARAMVGVDIGVNISIFIGILIGSVIISVGLSMLLYRSTINRLDEGGMSQNMSKAATKLKKDSPIIAEIRREIKIIIRSPELFIQTIMMVVISPILIVVFGLLENDMPSEEGIDTTLFFTAMTFFYQCITIGLNYLASIGISREREMLGMLKTLPVTPREIIRAKMLFADAATVFVSIICGIVYAVFAKDTPWYSIIIMIVMVSAQGTSLNAYSLYRDAKKPNLKWMTVREITKNNFSAIIPMIISMAVGIALSLIAGALSYGGLNRDAAFLIFWAIVAVIEIAFYFVFRYKKIEKIAVLFEAIEG